MSACALPLPADALSSLSLASVYMLKAAEAIRVAVSLAERRTHGHLLDSAGTGTSPLIELFGVAVQELERISRSSLLTQQPASTSLTSLQVPPIPPLPRAQPPVTNPLSSPVSPKSTSFGQPRRLSFAGSDLDTTFDDSYLSQQETQSDKDESIIESTLRTFDLSIASSPHLPSPGIHEHASNSDAGPSLRSGRLDLPSEDFGWTERAFRPAMVRSDLLDKGKASNSRRMCEEGVSEDGPKMEADSDDSDMQEGPSRSRDDTSYMESSYCNSDATIARNTSDALRPSHSNSSQASTAVSSSRLPHAAPPKPSSSSLLHIPSKPSFMDGRYNRKRSASPDGRDASRKTLRFA